MYTLKTSSISIFTENICPAIWKTAPPPLSNAVVVANKGVTGKQHSIALHPPRSFSALSNASDRTLYRVGPSPEAGDTSYGVAF